MVSVYFVILICLCILIYFAKVNCIETFDEETFAIITMTRSPHNLNYWIEHHFKCGASKLYVYFDDPDDAAMSRVQQDPRLSMYVMTTEFLSSLGYDRQRVQQTGMDMSQLNMFKQELVAGHAITQARAADIKYLIHIDTDELLYTPSGQAIARTFAEIGQHSDRFIITNWELAVTDTYENCFLEGHSFRTQGVNYVAYGNGKGAAKLTPNSKPHGVHRFTGSSQCNEMAVPENLLVVLHYVSCNVSEMLKKHQYFANFKDDDFRWAHDYRKNRDDLRSCEDETCKIAVAHKALIDRRPQSHDILQNVYLNITEKVAK